MLAGMAEQPVDYNIYVFQRELEQNKFTRFYLEIPKEHEKYQRQPDSDIQHELRKYTHFEAVRFATETWNWGRNTNRSLPRRSIGVVPTSTSVTGLRAYYRVLTEKEHKYVLIACHANIHGHHRGDLRFVEVNDRTFLRGMEMFSVIGRLFPGDIVAVTKLAKKSEKIMQPPNVFNVHSDTDCTWEVQEMTLLTRKEEEKQVNFAVLEKGSAIVEGRGEAMNVIVNPKNRLKTDTMYVGYAFIPEKIQFNYTEDFHMKYQNDLIAMITNMASYANALGTIYQYHYSQRQTDQLRTGQKAFAQGEFLRRSNEIDIIVEKCVMMGASAAQTVSNGRFDGRGFTMKDIERDGFVLHFTIPNPAIRPTEGLWHTNNRIVINGRGGNYDAIIETVVLSINRRNLRIAVRLPRDCTAEFTGIWIVQQRNVPEIVRFQKGFFKNLPSNSNGRKVIETLYGGAKINIQDYRVCEYTLYCFPSYPDVMLNEYQNNYVSMILSDMPLVLGNSPFGCGKSMTIVTAAIEVHKRNNRFNKNGHHRQQLLVTQTNNASVSLIDIARRVAADVQVRFLRYVSESNWKTLSEASRTVFDVPVLMRNLFVQWATCTLYRVPEALSIQLKRVMVRKVVQSYLHPDCLVGEARRIFDSLQSYEQLNPPSPRTLREAFFILYQPDVIVTTADSLPALLRCNCLKYIANVQIDEASQLPEHTLIYLLQQFPHAGFGLVGDIKQLPPHCETELIGLLKDYGIGNTMQRALENEMFPQSILRYVYRCHPVTTNLLSELFYENRLLSGVQENDRNEFLRMRQDIWPNHKFPILVLNHEDAGYRMGKSVANESEKFHVMRIVQSLTRHVDGYQLQHSDIGVISFYRAQASLLTEAFRGSNVKCGTIDAFQGTEREIIILCCTNDKPSDFMKCANRLNVAMSRARQATIIIGNVGKLRGATYWSTIVEKARQNDCLFEEIGNFGDRVDPARVVPRTDYGDSTDDEDNDMPKTNGVVNGNGNGIVEAGQNRRAQNGQNQNGHHQNGHHHNGAAAMMLQSVAQNGNSSGANRPSASNQTVKRRERRLRAEQRRMEQDEIIKQEREARRQLQVNRYNVTHPSSH